MVPRVDGRIKEPQLPLSGRTLTSAHTRQPQALLKSQDMSIVGPKIHHKKPAPIRAQHALEGVTKVKSKLTYIRQSPQKPKIRLNQRNKSVENQDMHREANVSPNILVEDEDAKYATLDFYQKSSLVKPDEASKAQSERPEEHLIYTEQT